MGLTFSWISRGGIAYAVWVRGACGSVRQGYLASGVMPLLFDSTQIPDGITVGVERMLTSPLTDALGLSLLTRDQALRVSIVMLRCNGRVSRSVGDAARRWSSGYPLLRRQHHVEDRFSARQ